MCKVAIVQLTPSTICHVVCDINVFWKPLQLFSHMYGLIIFSIQTLKIVFFTRLQTQKTLCKHIHTHTHTHTPGDLCRPGARSIVHAMKSTKAFAAST